MSLYNPNQPNQQRISQINKEFCALVTDLRIYCFIGTGDTVHRNLLFLHREF